VGWEVIKKKLKKTRKKAKKQRKAQLAVTNLSICGDGANGDLLVRVQQSLVIGDSLAL
jgi:hypothetical protein